MDDKDFWASCDFLKESFTWNETEELENIPEDFELKYLRRNLMRNCYRHSVKYHFEQYQSLVLIMAVQ